MRNLPFLENFCASGRGEGRKEPNSFAWGQVLNRRAGATHNREGTTTTPQP